MRTGIVGQKYELSKLEIAYAMPQKANWPGIRKIGCELYDTTGRKLAASARATAS